MTVLATYFIFPALLLPPTSLPHAPLSPSAAGSAPSPIIMSGSVAPRPPRQPGSWQQRAKQTGVALATAAMLAFPRGPARAAPLTRGGGSDSPGAGSSMSAPADLAFERAGAKRKRPQQRPLALLNLHRAQKKGSLVQPLPLEDAPDEIDMDKIVPDKMTKRYTERSFIFSSELTQKSDLATELEELDEVKNERAFERAASTATTYAVVAGGVYLAVKGGQSFERYMKQQELKDIEEERELTGQYISVDAGDVDTSIDPLTGKNLTIVKRDEPKAKPTAGDGNTTVVAGEEKQAPWILRVLGLDGTKAADDDDFWAPSVAASTPRFDPSAGGGGAGGAGSAGDAPDGGPSGTDGGEDGGDSGGDGLEDDASDLDDINDLI